MRTTGGDDSDPRLSMPRSEDATLDSSRAVSARKSEKKYWFLGSPKAEVLAIQGPPTGVRRFSGSETLFYEVSTVTIENGRVSEYMDFSENLLVRTEAIAPQSSGAYWAIGSSKEAVLAIQGTPTGVSRFGATETLFYEVSTVTIVDGIVSQYMSYSGNLLVRVAEEDSASGQEYWTIGSTLEQVLAIQGRPSFVRSVKGLDEYFFGLSSITLYKGRVLGYENFTGNLKVSVFAVASEIDATRWSLGSARQDVLALQGTPTAIRRDGLLEILVFERSSVTIQSGRVSEFEDLSENLLTR